MTTKVASRSLKWHQINKQIANDFKLQFYDEKKISVLWKPSGQNYFLTSESIIYSAKLKWFINFLKDLID